MSFPLGYHTLSWLNRKEKISPTIWSSVTTGATTNGKEKQREIKKSKGKKGGKEYKRISISISTCFHQCVFPAYVGACRRLVYSRNNSWNRVSGKEQLDAFPTRNRIAISEQHASHWLALTN